MNAVATYGFDGLRVDTVPEVKRDFWKEYSEAAGVFTMGEVFNGDIGLVASYQGSALDATLNYPLYFTIKDTFGYSGSFYNIRNIFTAEN